MLFISDTGRHYSRMPRKVFPRTYPEISFPFDLRKGVQFGGFRTPERKQTSGGKERRTDKNPTQINPDTHAQLKDKQTL
jgi:hypothetical protein